MLTLKRETEASLPHSPPRISEVCSPAMRPSEMTAFPLFLFPKLCPPLTRHSYLKLKPQNISLFDCSLAIPFQTSQEIWQACFWEILGALGEGALLQKTVWLNCSQRMRWGKQPPLAVSLELQSSKSPSMRPNSHPCSLLPCHLHIPQASFLPCSQVLTAKVKHLGL